MRKHYLLAAAALAATAVPAFAQTVDYGGTTYSSGETITISFTGLNDPTLSGTLNLTFTGTDANDYTFLWSLANTSNSLTNPGASISAFGFDISGGTLDLDTSYVTTDGNPSGAIDNISSGNISGGVGNSVDFCATSGPNCAGGSSGGVVTGDTWTGTLGIEFTSLPDSIFLSDPRIRFQSTGLDEEGSDIGVPTDAIPEPGTWAMMLFGFGAAGVALRRSRRKSPVAQLA